MELSYFAIIIGAIFVNNVVLGVSSKVETSLGMGAAVTFVMAIAAVVAWLIQTYVLVPLDIVYMQTIVFILVIAALVQMVEIMLKKLSPSLYQALGIFLVLFAGIRERLDFEDVPKAFKGIPIALITAGILAMAFMGFSGLV